MVRDTHPRVNLQELFHVYFLAFQIKIGDNLIEGEFDINNSFQLQISKRWVV